MRLDESAGLAALDAVYPVSRETSARLATFVSLLVAKWQKAENLIAPSTLGDIWTRHVADSAQLIPLAPEARHWLDLGSGGGFPGLVVAILLSGEAVALAWRSTSSRATPANARSSAPPREKPGPRSSSTNERIEATLVGVVGARRRGHCPGARPARPASGPVGDVISPERPALFLKGVDYPAEIEKASQTWDLDLLVHPSQIGQGAAILEIRRATRKAEARTSRP